MAQRATAGETVGECKFMGFIGYGRDKATTLYQDNYSAIARENERKNSGKANHIDVRYHYTTGQIKKCFIKLKYLCSLELQHLGAF